MYKQDAPVARDVVPKEQVPPRVHLPPRLGRQDETPQPHPLAYNQPKPRHRHPTKFTELSLILWIAVFEQRGKVIEVVVLI